MKITFSPGEALEQFASHDTIEVGIALTFVLYSAGFPIPQHELDVMMERIALDLTALGVSREKALRLICDALAKFGDRDQYERTTIMPEIFKAAE